MENYNQNLGNANWTPPNSNAGMELPGAQGSMIMGIIGLVLTLCAGCSLAGIILSIIAFNKGRSAIELHENSPGMYSESSAGQARTGKILGIIGMIIGGLALLGLIAYVALMGVAGAWATFDN